MNTQSSRIAEVLASKQADLDAQKAEAAQKVALFNVCCKAAAETQINELLGDFAEEMKGIIVSGGHDENGDGVWTSLSLTYQSDEMQIAPVRVIWTPSETKTMKAGPGSIMVAVAYGDGRERFIRHEPMDEILFFAHQSWADWKMWQEERERAEREKQIGNILGWNDSNISGNAGYENAWQRICYLSRIDQNLADMKWEEHCRRAIESLRTSWAWQPGNSETLVMSHYAELKRYSPDLAEAKLAEWRAAVVNAQLKREARQAAEAAYKAAIAEWREACRVWAEEWTAKLWQPWELIKVRYTPLQMPADFDYELAAEGGLIEEVAVLNEIADCVAVGANLTEVKGYNGSMSEIVIGAFLDAHVIKCDAPSTTDVLAYHRHYSEGGYVVNVPAFVAEQPDPAPEKPATPEGVREIYNDEEIPF